MQTVAPQSVQVPSKTRACSLEGRGRRFQVRVWPLLPATSFIHSLLRVHHCCAMTCSFGFRVLRYLQFIDP